MMKSILISILFLISYSLSGQVGINTFNPQNIFHIDGLKNNPTTGSPPLPLQSDDFVVNSNGNVGVGTLSPLVRLDARSTNGTENAIAIGYTTKSAASAGAGAIRYVDNSGGKIQISNGVIWEEIPSNPIKSGVVARINAANNSKKFVYNTIGDVSGWEETADPTNSFDPVTGIFTAPRNGVYTVSFTFDFVYGPVLANSSVESQIVKNGSIVEVKCLKAYGKSTRNSQAAGSCITSISLAEGDKIKLRLLQLIDNTTSGGRGLRSVASPPGLINDPFFGFNNLTIVEQ